MTLSLSDQKLLEYWLGPGNTQGLAKEIAKTVKQTGVMTLKQREVLRKRKPSKEDWEIVNYFLENPRLGAVACDIAKNVARFGTISFKQQIVLRDTYALRDLPNYSFETPVIKRDFGPLYKLLKGTDPHD